MQERAAADPGEGVDPSCHKYFTNCTHLRQERGKSWGSAIDYRVARGKPFPHSASSLQFEALLGGTQGGLRSWVGEGPEPLPR